MNQLTPDKILQTGLAFWPSKTLLSAVEMNLFTELAHGAERFEALRGRLGLHPRSARDFLDTLVALGFLTRSGDQYANTPETDLFLDRKKPSYVGGILEMANQAAVSVLGPSDGSAAHGPAAERSQGRRAGPLRRHSTPIRLG